jgi:diadenylate cyclase
MPQEKLGFWESIVEFISDFVIFPIVNISIVNILDILLLSFLIYIIYKFIRDRHAGRTLIGFGLIMLLYIISDILGMVAINSILKNFYAVGIIALCVLFQPELREVLAEFGTTTSLNFRRIRNRHTVDDDNILQAIEEISAAAFDLSSRREGALIVLERSGRLYNQMTEGTPVDAVVSRQLLCNIFVNRSPLHDGAVIIRDCRIVSASNKSKTISEDADIAEGLGTRHRAALKISEISDAVVLIVSEETGTISIANNKILNRYYDDIGKGGKHKSTDLRDDLFKLMTGKSVNDMLIDRIAKGVTDKTKKTDKKEGKENGTNETV